MVLIGKKSLTKNIRPPRSPVSNHSPTSGKNKISKLPPPASRRRYIAQSCQPATALVFPAGHSAPPSLPEAAPRSHRRPPRHIRPPATPHPASSATPSGLPAGHCAPSPPRAADPRPHRRQPRPIRPLAPPHPAIRPADAPHVLRSHHRRPCPIPRPGTAPVTHF
jgi:hypothetical protein